MFAPSGYVPAAKLWDEFSTARLPDVYVKAAQGYADGQFYAALSRGSPLDICEHIFLLALSEIGISVAAVDGTVLDLHVRYEDGFTGLFSKLSPMIAAGAIWNASRRDEEFELNEAGTQGRNFAPWKFKSDDNDAYKNVYPEPSDDLPEKLTTLRFHSLPVLFDRDSLTIVKALPAWAENANLGHTEMALIENFGGRSICVSKEKLNDVWREYVDGIRLPYREYLSKHSDASRVARGRPKEYKKSRALWAEMEFDKGDRSWTQIENYIARQTGERPSAKTLRDWAKKAEANVSPGENRGKTRKNYYQ